MSKPSLLMTLLVRDEIETVQLNIDYHRSVGVEKFIVTDNGSIDGTAELLREMAAKGEITLLEEPAHTHNQGAWVTRMARLAAEDESVDWIIHCDADEFFWNEASPHDLPSYFAAVPSDVHSIRVKRFNVLKDPRSDDDCFLVANQIAIVGTSGLLRPKVCHRPSKDARVSEGNHGLVGSSAKCIDKPDGITAWHFPYRSYEKFEQKIIKGAEALMRNKSLPDKIGKHWRGAYEKYKRGELKADFARHTLSKEQSDEALRDGSAFKTEAFTDYVRKSGILKEPPTLHSPRRTNAAKGKQVVANEVVIAESSFGPEHFCYVDIGARGGAPHPEGATLPVIKVLFEPEPEEFRKLEAASPNDIVIGAALGDVDGKIPFYEAKNPYCSSALKPNMALLGDYRIAQHFEVVQESRVQCLRFDTLYSTGKLPVPHCVKIDVQGFEHQVLQGFGPVLDDVLAIRIESHFYPLYDGQKLLHDIIELLSPHHFMLRRLMNQRSPNLDGDRHFGGDLVEVDAVFTKSRKWLSDRNELAEKFRLACSALGVSPY